MTVFGFRRADRLMSIAQYKWNLSNTRFKHHNPSKKANKERLWYHKYKQQKSQVVTPMQFSLLNPNRTVDARAMSQCVEQPLSVSLQRFECGEDRIYHPGLPSVTTVLQHTRPASEYFALRNWQKAQISELGQEGLTEKRRTITTSGTTFHHNIQAYLRNHQQPQLSEKQSGYWQSAAGVLKDITNVVAVESGTVHPKLGYAGTLDLVAEYQGILSIIDWKTSRKSKSKLKECYSYPVQVVAYAGAVNFDLNYPFQVCNAVIVIVYEDGREADVHVMPREMCEEYWQKWLQRLAEYNESDARHLRQVPVNAGSASAGSVIAGSALMQKNRTKHQMDAKTVNSIGVPVSSIGTVVRDKDVISERCSLLSRVLRDFLGSRILEWKLLKSIVSLLRRLFSRNVRKR